MLSTSIPWAIQRASKKVAEKLFGLSLPLESRASSSDQGMPAILPASALHSASQAAPESTKNIHSRGKTSNSTGVSRLSAIGFPTDPLLSRPMRSKASSFLPFFHHTLES
jgi:hypothetical protein